MPILTGCATQALRLIGMELPDVKQIDLRHASPRLLAARHLELAMPGTYRAGCPVVSICEFVPTLTVIATQQRPRKLQVLGSDGRVHTFLLKGREDLRQDERVAQLFLLVNNLLSSGQKTHDPSFQMVRYAVVPLSTNSGLLRWVPRSDTLHALVREYRVPRNILLNIEHRLMLHMAPDYDHLPLMHKVEVFEHALASTSGADLSRVMHARSPSSEAWLSRRTMYTRSLAVSSMVGHVLGLGDRHPSNMMVHRTSGKVIHIDFGDCFEVAMTRTKWPEKVPFRLTRMLVNAMEASGIEGTFRRTCEAVMELLREHASSILAMLEAFVHDPLIKWRLLDQGARAGAGATNAVNALRASGERGEQHRVSERDDDDASSTSSQSVSDADARSPTALRQQWRHLQELEAQALAAGGADPEALNSRAVRVIQRVNNKLTGREFGSTESISVAEQVQRLIEQATATENLACMYVGWCPFW